MSKRITSWTAKTLLYAGRVQLIQSVLFGIQAFWAQLFILQTKVIKLVEGICRSYVWSGANEITKKALIAWDRVCLPKVGGGLNIVNLKLWNKAAIAKTCWDLAYKQGKLWIRWIHTYYIKNQQMSTMAIPQQACWMVRKVIEAHSILEAGQILPNQRKSMIRQIYLHLLGDYRRMEWKTLMFQNAARPKAKFIMWLMVQGRLLTSDRLENWKIFVDTECAMCRKEVETRDHLFGQQFLGVSSWQQFLQWSISEAKGKTQHAQGLVKMKQESHNQLIKKLNLHKFKAEIKALTAKEKKPSRKVHR
ncbi:uncharacterized protein LOC142174479 [Nicotiana tabacum]|uniref:Uncharacterized protein LOC142174479 n=1 Tax=Nicotiana tabacum TaxID=4097 RepID=A0AC58TGN1_TOBAC